MKIALDLAKKAKGKTSPNPMVGAVLVKRNKIIAKGYHKRAGSDHAETVVLKKAGKKAHGSTLYVTLEPCYHVGRTPPCVDSIIDAKIKKVIVAMKDPNGLTNGKSLSKLRRHRIATKLGVLQREAENLNESFIKCMRKGMPFVVAKTAQTLDGKIATSTGDSKWITSKKTREHSRKVRNDFDAIMVGINTVLRDNPRLNGSSKNRQIKKVIVDSQLRTPIKAKLFQGTKPENVFIAISGKASLRKKKIFEKKGVNILVAPMVKGSLNLRWIMKELVKYDVLDLLIEGGAHLVGSALKSRLVDKMHIYLAAKIVGDARALDSVVGLNTRSIEQSLNLQDMNIKLIDKDILVTGYVLGNR